ncbi:MAG: hypothetical protein ACJAT7_001458 [Psychromonas sp.]|jgi:hypothetical protein|uniref:DUF6933 domain-containing protein n=1 Tax=Psychromonas sp. TaxID=1884585 RepID=UPI0039E345C1
MLVFNCTKAASDFFTCTKNKVKHSPIKQHPHKTIAESVANPFYPDDLTDTEQLAMPWHWVVHCITLKRKKVLIVMDYHSRFSICFYAGKKGDELDFLNTFELHLMTNFNCLASLAGISSEEVEVAADIYNASYLTCEFYQRGDRSVQAHINDVAWHLERCVYDDAFDFHPQSCLEFNQFTGKTLRKTKGQKDYFYPSEEFVANWLNLSMQEPPISRIEKNSAAKSAVSQSTNNALSSNVFNIKDYRK